MKAVFFFLIALVFYAGCAGSGIVQPPTDPVKRLKYDIDRLLSDSLFIPARAGITVVSLESGDVLYERDNKILMHAASNLKLLTSSTALDKLGKDFEFKTCTLIDSMTASGTVLGNVYLKGFGDPDLKTADLDSLAKVLKLCGVDTVLGNVVGDASYFDDLSWGSGWMWDDEPESDEMYISALSVNKNCVSVTVTPGDSAGVPARVSIDPVTRYTDLINNAVTVRDTVMKRLRVSRRFRERSNTITVDGEILADTSARRVASISVWQPELYAAELFKEAMERAGILVFGRVSIGITSVAAVEKVRHVRRLDSVIVNLNKVSDNLSAENTLKTIAATVLGLPGTAQNGITIVHQFLDSFGIDSTQYVMVDGSGVSHYNLLTSEIVTRLLLGMYRRSDLFPVFYESLPIAGIDGTLDERMRRTLAEGNLRAKTGTISGVSSLSGYVHGRDGELLAFSILMQNFAKSPRRYRNVQDSLGVILAGFSRYRQVAPTIH
ncbi:MAG: D-alanyl-D-alanine carboxypeptidase/D-alanyl-D-alanine-endopeptidase [Bacteroidota bacterium]